MFANEMSKDLLYASSSLHVSLFRCREKRKEKRLNYIQYEGVFQSCFFFVKYITDNQKHEAGLSSKIMVCFFSSI